MNSKSVKFDLDALIEEKNREYASKRMEIFSTPMLFPDENLIKTDGQTNKHLSKQMPKQTTEQIPQMFYTKLPDFDLSKRPADLNPNEYRILYEIYFQRPFKVSGEDRIGSSPQFPIRYGTVRNILKRLKNRGYISNIKRISCGRTLGTNCRIDAMKCEPIFGPTHIENVTPEKYIHESKQIHKSYRKIEREIKKKISFSFSETKFWSRVTTQPRFERILSKKYLHKIPPDMLQTIDNQLFYAANNKGVINAKYPVDYFLGGLTDRAFDRPKFFRDLEGKQTNRPFELPQERDKRLRQKKLKRQETQIPQEKEPSMHNHLKAVEPQFKTFIEKKSNISHLINKFKRKYSPISTGQKNAINTYFRTGQMNDKLYLMLHKEFYYIQSDNNESEQSN
ncbi:MAG: hypothetical protein HUN04_12370 [Desulfobacter sp.]|nr:MAG: hypothetical protein HUN04_12370 [Desulfobacter sp.]